MNEEYKRKFKLGMAWIGKNLDIVICGFFICLICFGVLCTVGITAGKLSHTPIHLAIIYTHLWAGIIAAITFVLYEWYNWGKDNYDVINSEVDLYRARDRARKSIKTSSNKSTTAVPLITFNPEASIGPISGSFSFPFNDIEDAIGKKDVEDAISAPIKEAIEAAMSKDVEDPIDEIEIKDSITEAEEHYKKLISALEKEKNAAFKILERHTVHHKELEEAFSKLAKENEELKQKLLEAQSHSDNAIADLE
jgi:hypothetical protein